MLMAAFAPPASAQDYLSRKITLHAHQQRITEVLHAAGTQGGFYFSYKSSLFREDSLVDISINNKSVAYLLDRLFADRFRYLQQDRYLIIQPKEAETYLISGIITDKNTGESVSNATIYEKEQLASTMSNDQGYFQLQIKERTPDISISISKISYRDTVIRFNGKISGHVSVSITPEPYLLDSVIIFKSSGVEGTWLGRTFLSSRIRMNSLNLGGFFASRPYQFSLVPGLGSHGKMSGQVINRFSFNVLGGYSAGVNGFELGSIFNIVKQDAQYVQIAGIVNIVGGSSRGIQVGGIHNTVLGSLRGVQVSGTTGIVKKQMSGMQVAGLVSYADSSRGAQISGLVNISRRGAGGLQLAGLVNYTSIVKGVQIGLVNIADTSEGYSIGLINIIRKGYHEVSFSTSEMQPVTIAFKTGNRRLYSILMAGAQLNADKKAYSLGYGIGHEAFLGKSISLNPELCTLLFYQGNWSTTTQVSRLQVHLTVHLNKYIALYAGPAVSLKFPDGGSVPAGYKPDIGSHYPSVAFGRGITAWIGWNAGISLF